ncbi:MAG: hypothetical protein MI717_05605 [Spirochaetales bacterium]|nr:hypothetical protein [Spirochaetales bacterium]
MVRIRGRHLLILLFFALVFSGCKNELISEIAHYYSPGVQAQDIRPPQINASNIATGDLTLVLAAGDGATVSWETSSHSGLAVNGQLIQPAFSQPDITADITATVTYKSGRRARFTFEVIVPALAATDAEAVAAAAAALTPGYQGGDTASDVTNNLVFVTSGLHATQISWNASALSSITDSGTVTRPSYSAGDESGTLQATVSKGIATTVVSFSLTVIRLPIGDALAVTEAAAALAIQYQSGDSASSVTDNLGFPSTGLHSTNVSWNASALSSVLNSGVVNQPLFADGNESGTILATVSRGAESSVVNFPITVMSLPASDSESVSIAAAALAIGYQSGDSSTNVTQNLTFATSGLQGTTVTWNASALGSISNTGVVNRPAYPASNQTGTIVATVSKGSSSSSVNFPITVIAIPPTDFQAVSSVVTNLIAYVEYASGDNNQSVTQTLTLKTSGDHGTTISWDTSSHARVNSDGTVNTVSNHWYYPVGSTVEGRLYGDVSRGSTTIRGFTTVHVVIGIAPAIPTPTGFSTSTDATRRYLQFTKPTDGDDEDDYRVEYRVYSGGWGTWSQIAPGVTDTSTGTVKMGWTTSELATGHYQFRVRMDYENSGSIYGSWGTSGEYTSF